MQDQHATQYDHFMNSLWQWFSDGDAAKILARLKDQKIRYIAIDPSIGTVVQNEGNVSLFERYFALVDRKDAIKPITQGGVMTTISDLVSRGDMSYIHSNNLAIKYGLVMTDEDAQALINNTALSPDARAALTDDLSRVKYELAAFRYCKSGQGNVTSQFCLYTPWLEEIMIQYMIMRIEDGRIVEDMADIHGADPQKVQRAINRPARLKKAPDTVKHAVSQLA